VTLWILFCRMQSNTDALFTFYARDRDHAEQQATELLEACSYERVDLKAFPGGFVIHHTPIPGTIEEGRG
jgi:hypothetical protein